MYRITAVRAGQVVRLKRSWPEAFATARRLRALGWTVGVARLQALQLA